MSELLGCPFCGGNAIRCGNNDINPRHWVMCRDCHACPGGDVADLAAAEIAWNRRALTAPQLHQHGGGVEAVIAELRAEMNTKFTEGLATISSDQLAVIEAALAQQPLSVPVPVAYRIKDYGDGWILQEGLTDSEREIYAEQGNLVQALYVTPAAPKNVGGEE